MTKSIFARFTPDNPDIHSLDSIEDFIKNYTDTYVFSYEIEASRPHYHLALFDVSISTELFRNHLKKLEGQVYISGKDIADKVKTIAYTIKDGLYRYCNLDVNDYLMANSIKKKKIKYDDRLKEIEQSYLRGLIDDKALVTQIVEAHIQSNKKIYIQHIKAQLSLIKLKNTKNQTYREILINKILEDY